MASSTQALATRRAEEAFRHAQRATANAFGWSRGPTARLDVNRNSARSLTEAADAYLVAADALEEAGDLHRADTAMANARQLLVEARRTIEWVAIRLESQEELDLAAANEMWAVGLELAGRIGDIDRRVAGHHFLEQA